MTIFEKLKASLVEDDAPVQPAPEMPPIVAPGGPVESVPAPSGNTTTRLMELGPNADDVEKIMAKVYPNSGPLAQFLLTLTSLTSYIPDEGTRFHATQEALKTQGVGTYSVLEHLRKTIALVASEDERFESNRQARTESDVTARETRLADLAEQIKTHEDAIRTLTAQRDQVAVELTAAKSKIASRTEEWKGAIRQVTSTYEDITRKINMYLMGGAK